MEPLISTTDLYLYIVLIPGIQSASEFVVFFSFIAAVFLSIVYYATKYDGKWGDAKAVNPIRITAYIFLTVGAILAGVLPDKDQSMLLLVNSQVTENNIKTISEVAEKIKDAAMEDVITIIDKIKEE